MEILEDLQSTKKNTTIRMMGFILIKILKSKLQGLYINEQKLLTVILPLLNNIYYVLYLKYYKLIICCSNNPKENSTTFKKVIV